MNKISFRKKITTSNTRLLVVVFAGIVLLISYFLVHSYQLSIQQSKENVLDRLMAITHTASLMISGELHQQLSESHMTKDTIRTNDENMLYYRLHQTLANIKKVNNLESDVYTLVYYARDSTFHFIGTSAEYPYFRHSYKNYPIALLTHYDTGGTLDVYEDENGIWLSAFSPIRNSEGKIVALIEADEHFEMFLEKARIELFQNSILSIAIVFPFAFLLIQYLSVSLSKQAETQAKLQEQNEEIKSQNEEILSQSEVIERHNHELDEKVTERTLALTKSNQQLSSFIYHSSHDVQAPLATLKGILTIAEMDLKDEKSASYIAMMRETTVKLSKMVKTLQIVHEIKSREVLIESVNLFSLVKTTASEILGLRASAVMQYAVNESLSIKADRVFLQIIVRELIKNANQYTADKEKKTIIITAIAHEKLMELTVEDNGDGIDTSKQEALFSLFNRSHESSEGMGLGLFISQTCAERLQGKLSLQPTEVGKGAKFLLQLSNNQQ
jgi:signal transduction histidine kinase